MHSDMYGQLRSDLSVIKLLLGRFEEVETEKLLSMSVTVCYG
jgi:hypothetical protein